MTRTFAGCLVALGVLALLAAVAGAAGLVEGTGYRLAPPAGFVPLHSERLQASLLRTYDLATVRGIRGQPEVRLLGSGSGDDPDAVLIAVRMELKPGAPMHTARDLHRYMLDRVHVDKDIFDRMMLDGDVLLRSTSVGSYRAVEMSHPGAQGRGGVAEPPTRAVVVLGEAFMLVVVLQVRDTYACPPDEAWARVRSSLEVDPPAAFMRTILLYSGGAVGVLILLVLLARMRAESRMRVYRPYSA